MASTSSSSQISHAHIQPSSNLRAVIHVPYMHRRALKLSRQSCTCRAAVEEQTQAAEQNQRVALGSVVIESTERFPEPQKDFWEGEQWEVQSITQCSSASLSQSKIQELIFLWEKLILYGLLQSCKSLQNLIK